VGKPVAEAAIKKSDWFDPCMVWKDTNAATMDRNASDTQFETFFDTYVKQVSPALSRLREPRPGPGMSGDMTNAECAYSNFFYPNWDDTLAAFDPNNPASFAYTLLSPDAGAAYWDYDMISRYDPVRPGGEGFPGFRGVMQPKGSAMPGVGSAYQTNAPQAFSGEPQKESGDNYPGYDSALRFFSAKGLPQFPTDDGGRHNAYPIMRVQAKDKSGKLLGTTDAVTAVTTELKCAECHTKGKNGADQSIYDGLLTDMGWSFNKTDGFKEIPGAPVKAGLEKYKGREKWIPQFVTPEDLDAARKNERDVIEQASMINIARLHDFYYNFIDESGWLGPLEFESEQLYGKKGEVRVQPGNCTDYCHKSVPRADPRRYNMAPHYDAAEGAGGACPEMSDSLHNIHGRLLGKMNADYTGTIKRDPLNRELILADLSKAQDPAWPFFLKVADAGTPDDSCYFCHAGRQDKYQRDVMANAGVNCIDCHGDLAVLAGGGAMVSRDKSGNPLDSRGGPGDLSTPIDKEKLAFAYSAEEASYGDGADGNWHYLEKGPDGLYRHKGEIVTTLDMVLNFLSDTTGVDNGNGTFTLTTKSEGNPDVVATVTEAELLDKVKVDVNGWNLHFARIPWAEELSCANCHTGNGDEPVRRRAYDMTTGKFRLLPVTNERFAENMLPKKHDSSFTLEVQDGQNCPPGTFSDSVTPGGKHVCERGLFKDSLDRHGHMPCESCHGSTHAIWPNPNPYANDNVTAMQLQGHTGTILECTVCHTADAFKNESDLDGGQYSGDKKAGILGGPHNIHPVNDTYWWKSTNGSSKDGGYHNMWSKKPGKDGEDQCAACHGADHKGTRLSKTPVDRVLEMGKTKRFKKVTVKAGTAISCDLCHSIEQSFIK
jgi:mono/diheme cytochrome c family protein